MELLILRSYICINILCITTFILYDIFSDKSDKLTSFITKLMLFNLFCSFFIFSTIILGIILTIRIFLIENNII